MAEPHPFLNAWQVAAAHTYGEGIFSYLVEQTTEAEYRDMLTSCGDTLFQFVMRELATSEGCESAEQARRRIESAIDDLQAVLVPLKLLC